MGLRLTIRKTCTSNTFTFSAAVQRSHTYFSVTFNALVKKKPRKLPSKKETPIYFSTLVPLSVKLATLLIMFTEVLQGYPQPYIGEHEMSVDHALFRFSFQCSCTQLSFPEKSQQTHPRVNETVLTRNLKSRKLPFM